MIHADLSPDARPTRAPAAASRIFFITKRKRVRNTQKKPSPGQTYFWVSRSRNSCRMGVKFGGRTQMRLPNEGPHAHVR